MGIRNVVPFAVFVTLALCQGCVRYVRQPLGHAQVAQRLAPPNLEAVRLHAKRLRHPPLKPVEINLQDGLSPNEAALIAVLANPALVALRDRRGIAAAQLIQAGILPNPQFSPNVAVPFAGSTQGTVTAFGFGLDWDVHSLLGRAERVEAARSQVGSVDLDIAWQEWQVAHAARRQVYRLLALSKELEFAQREVRGLEENLEVVEKAFALRDVTVIDLAAAQAALQRARASVVPLQRQEEQDRLLLNRTLGLPPEQIIPLQAPPTWESVQALPKLDELLQGMEDRRLDLVALRLGYQSQDARLRAAIRAQFPRISIGLSQSRDNTNVVSTGFGLVIGLPFFDRNQGVIAFEEATRNQLFDEYIARVFESRSQVARLLANIASLQEEIQVVQSSIPILENLVRTYRLALLDGNADVITYYNARTELVTRQEEVFRFQSDLAEQWIALEVSTGEYLETKGSGS